MRLPILILAFISLICSTFALTNPAGCAFPYAITQTARSSWTQNSTVYTIYDITITNTGSTSFAPDFFIGVYADSAFDISQAWNVIEYGYTDPRHQIISVLPSLGIQVAPSQSWTGSGYIVGGVETQLVLFSDSCPPNPAAIPSNSSSNSNCAQVSFNLRTSWNTDSTPYYLYDLTISNTGSNPLTSVSFTLISLAAFQIVQDWNLIDYAFTDPTQRPVGLTQTESISIPPNGQYTNAGLVISGAPINSVIVWQSNC